MKKRNSKAADRASSRRWPTYMLMLVCGLVLVSGFFLAGRQHFSSMDYGMKNSRLRKQLDELEGEKRRLLLAREVSLSPMEIKKAAKRSGMIDQGETTGMMAQVASVTKEKATPQSPASPIKSMIVKTAAISPVPASITASYRKPEKESPKPDRERVARQIKAE
ncbi:MAG: hypothetical protein ABJB40_03875 [Acidobacteriota bacterium]